MSDTPITDALLDDMGEGWPDRWAEMLKQFERELADAQEELAEAKDDLNDRRKFSYAVELALEGFKGDYIEIIKELVAAKKSAEPDSNKGVAFYTTPQPQQEKQPYAFEASMYSKGGMKIDPVTGNVSIGTPQPQREWVGLTEDEKRQILLDDPIDWINAIEFKLREKNT